MPAPVEWQGLKVSKHCGTWSGVEISPPMGILTTQDGWVPCKSIEHGPVDYIRVRPQNAYYRLTLNYITKGQQL